MKYWKTRWHKELADKTNGRCAYCGLLLDSHVKCYRWVPEHMIPRSRGGTNAWDNLVAACDTCNRIKGNRTPEEFKATIRARIFDQLIDFESAVDRVSGIIDNDVINALSGHIVELHEILRNVPVSFYMERMNDLNAKKGTWDEYTDNDGDLGTQYLEGNTPFDNVGAG